MDVATAPLIVRRFASAWAAPTADGLVALVAEDVRLYQPIRPAIVGRAAARDDFSRLLQWQPRLRAIVDDWAEAGHVFISFRLIFVFGEESFELPVVDHIVEREGLIAERTAYFDGLRLIGAVLRRPSAWLPARRYLRG